MSENPVHVIIHKGMFLFTDYFNGSDWAIGAVCVGLCVQCRIKPVEALRPWKSRASCNYQPIREFSTLILYFFPARRHAVMRWVLLAVVRCLSVCLCLSQVGVLSKRLNPRSILHCVIRKVRYLQNKSTFFRNFVPNFGLRKFCYGMISRSSQGVVSLVWLS